MRKLIVVCGVTWLHECDVLTPCSTFLAFGFELLRDELIRLLFDSTTLEVELIDVRHGRLRDGSLLFDNDNDCIDELNGNEYSGDVPFRRFFFRFLALLLCL